MFIGPSTRSIKLDRLDRLRFEQKKKKKSRLLARQLYLYLYCVGIDGARITASLYVALCKSHEYLLLATRVIANILCTIRVIRVIIALIKRSVPRRTGAPIKERFVRRSGREARGSLRVSRRAGRKGKTRPDRQRSSGRVRFPVKDVPRTDRKQ